MRQNLKLLLLICVSFGAGCAGIETYPAHPLGEQIIKPRPGHEGRFTNRTLSLDPADPKKVIEKIQDHDFSNPDFRETVNRLNFICNIGGKRYKICKDRPGFCRITYTKDCFLGMFCTNKDQVIEFISIDKYQFLLDANARCASRDHYDLWDRP